MKLLKSWDSKQHIHLKENERLFLVQLMQLYIFCGGKFTATLLLSRRVVSHKDFQMPCVKFLISPTIPKYIITQMQTSFKKCLSLKHVWPPFLDFRDLGFPFLFKPEGRGQRSSPSAAHTDADSNARVRGTCCTLSHTPALPSISLAERQAKQARNAATAFPRAAGKVGTDLGGAQKCQVLAAWGSCCEELPARSSCPAVPVPASCEPHTPLGHTSHRKIKGKTSSSFSCTYKPSLPHQQAAEGPVPYFVCPLYAHLGHLPAQGTTLTPTEKGILSKRVFK